MSTNRLPYQRFVKQASNGYARTKYSYQAMQQDLLQLLKNAPWKIATCPKNQVTTVPNKLSGTDASKSEDGTPTPASYTYFIDDKYDAYKQGGDAVVEEATMCGYAGLVAYRFKLPSSQASDITKVKLGFQMSRYLRSGLRVAVQLSDSDTPSQLWETIRGDGTGAIVSPHEAAAEEGVKSWGVFSQHYGTLIESRASDGTLEFKSADFPALATTTRYKYMYVYVSVEDYEDWWPLYDATTPRYYSIEGSAQLVGAVCEVTFEGDEVVDEDLTQCIVLDQGAVPDGKSPDLGQNWATMYDGLINGTLNTVIYGEQRNGSRAAALGYIANPEKFPRRSFTSFSGTIDTTSASKKVPLDDMYRFEAFKSSFTWDASLSSLVPSNSFSNDIGIILNAAPRGDRSRIWSPDGVTYAASGTWRSMAFVIPAGKSVYQTAKVSAAAIISMSSKRGLLKIGLNVWKSSSPDVLGQFGNAVVTEMLTYSQMYMVSEKSIQVSIKGTGTKSKDMTLTGEARYVGYMTLPLIASDDVSTSVTSVAQLTESVFPGDVVVLVPRIEQIITSSGTDTTDATYRLSLVDFSIG